MKNGLKYILAFFVPFLALSVLWSLTDIKVWGYEEITYIRWAGYQPKLWGYFSISLCSLIAAIVIGIVKLRWQMLFPILYTILVGYYFQRQVLEAYPPREVDDILFTMRAPWCLLSLLLTAVKDGLTCAFTSAVLGEGEKQTTDSTAPSEGTPSDG